MFKAITNRLALKGIVLMLLVAGLILLSNDSIKSSITSSQDFAGRSQLPVVSIEPQEDSPLRIISAVPESREQPNFIVRLMMQNQGGKRIRSYAITADNSTSRSQDTRIEFVNLKRPSSILQPTQIVPVGMSYSAPIERIRLSVDFVEFFDGTTWGTDKHNSRDRLAGQRAGARAEKQRIHQLLKTKRLAAVIESIETLDSSDVETLAGPNRSEEWLQGFRNSVGSIRHRLRQTLQEGRSPQLEIELDKPYDTSVENPK